MPGVLKSFKHGSVMSLQWPAIKRMFLSAICLAAGLALAIGGIWLIAVGGSLYYALAGFSYLLIGGLLSRRNAWAYWAYAILVLATLIWAVFEVGLDWWQLMPRGNFIIVLGLILALPSIARSFKKSTRDPTFTLGHVALVGSLLLSGAVALFSALNPVHDMSGNLPERTKDVARAISGAGKDWVAYGGTSAGDRYSTLDQITPTNVGQLQVAWTFHTGDVRGKNDPVETTYEVTPLKVDDTLYLCTPHDLVFALDAETGQEKWRFDPQIKQPPFQDTQHLTCRGVSYHNSARSSSASRPNTTNAVTGDCDKRLFLPTVDGRLIALSARTGKTCSGFGSPEGAVKSLAEYAQRRSGIVLLDVSTGGDR